MSKISYPTFSSFLSFPVCINSSIFSAIFSPTPTYIIYKIKTKKYINKTCKYINNCCKSTFRGVREPSMCRGSKCFLSKRQIKLFRIHVSNFFSKSIGLIECERETTTQYVCFIMFGYIKVF